MTQPGHCELDVYASFSIAKLIVTSLLFLSIVLAYVATIALAIGLFCLWVGFLDALGNAPTQALKAKDEEQGIPLPEISGGIDEDAAAPPYAPKTAAEAPAAVFSEEAAEWALSPNEEGGEDGSKGATLMNTSSSESQPTKGEEHFNLASQTSRPVDEHAAALPDESSTPWAAVVAETAEYALSSDSDEEDDNSDSYDYATASPGEPSTGQDPWAAVVYEAADLALASDEKKQQEKEGDDSSEANKHAATPQEEPSAQEEPSSAVMFEATEYHVPCVGEEEADDSSDATLLTPSSSEREWAAEESKARSAVREDETAKASGDSSNERTSVRGPNNQSRRAGHLRVVAPSQNSTTQSRKTRQEDRICAQQ